MARRADKGERSGNGEIPPPLELACLTVLWKQGESAVGEVQQALQPRRRLAYTTVMTVLERLARKGLVNRRKMGRAFRYAPTRERNEMRAQALAQLIDQFFDGSPEELARFLGARPSATDDSALAGLSLPSARPESEENPGDPPRFGSLDTSLL